jgi:hypothetical protein
MFHSQQHLSMLRIPITPIVLLFRYRDLFIGVKRPKREAHHSHLCSAEVENALLVRLHGLVLGRRSNLTNNDNCEQ